MDAIVWRDAVEQGLMKALRFSLQAFSLFVVFWVASRSTVAEGVTAWRILQASGVVLIVALMVYGDGSASAGCADLADPFPGCDEYAELGIDSRSKSDRAADAIQWSTAVAILIAAGFRSGLTQRSLRETHIRAI